MRTDNITPPHSAEAERSLIGACLISAEAVNEVTELLTPEDFYDTSCRIVYEAIKGLSHAGKPSDLVTVSGELKTSGDFERIGGMVYLAGLMSSVATTANIISHAQIVLEYSLRRRMLRASDKIAGFALKFELDSAGIISESERELLEASRVNESSNPVRISELTPTAIKTLDELHKTGGRKVTGYSTGFTNVDSILSGFQPGSLNIIAARPSMGKTALALNMAQFGGENGTNPHVLLFSLEMSSEQLIQRMLSAQSGVKLSDISSGRISDYDFLRVCNAAETLNERNIYIHDTPRLSATDFTTQCRRFKTRHPDLALIVVDYLQLMHVDGRKGDNRQQETADISRALKGVAVELGCPVLALSQLSREVERRTDLMRLAEIFGVDLTASINSKYHRGEINFASVRNGLESYGLANMEVACMTNYSGTAIDHAVKDHASTSLEVLSAVVDVLAQERELSQIRNEILCAERKKKPGKKSSGRKDKCSVHSGKSRTK